MQYAGDKKEDIRRQKMTLEEKGGDKELLKGAVKKQGSATLHWEG